MAKGKGTRGPYIKNSNLIGKGNKLQVIKDDQGNRQWAKAAEIDKADKAAKSTKQTPSPQIKESKLQQAAKKEAAKIPPKPAVEKKTPTVKPPGK